MPSWVRLLFCFPAGWKTWSSLLRAFHSGLNKARSVQSPLTWLGSTCLRALERKHLEKLRLWKPQRPWKHLKTVLMTKDLKKRHSPRRTSDYIRLTVSLGRSTSCCGALHAAGGTTSDSSLQRQPSWVSLFINSGGCFHGIFYYFFGVLWYCSLCFHSIRF